LPGPNVADFVEAARVRGLPQRIEAIGHFATLITQTLPERHGHLPADVELVANLIVESLTMQSILVRWRGNVLHPGSESETNLGFLRGAGTSHVAVRRLDQLPVLDDTAVRQRR
jgi:hypothetical protein